MPIGGLILCEKAKQFNEQLHANEATTPPFTASSGLLCMVFDINSMKISLKLQFCCFDKAFADSIAGE